MPSYHLDVSETGILVVHCTGDLSAEDAANLLEEIGAHRERRVVVSVGRLGQIDQEARRLLVQGLCGPPSGRNMGTESSPSSIAPPLARDFAVVGGSFRSRFVITSLLAERNILASARFFEGMAAAIAWARQTRDTLRPPPALGNDRS